MRPNNVVVIAKREFLQRAKTKAFWLTTLILPLFVSAVSVVPTLLLSKSKANQKIVVVDETGKVAPALVTKMNSHEADKPAGKAAQGFGGHRDRDDMVSFQAQAEPPAADRAAQQADLNRRVMAKQIDAWVWIS